MLVEAKFRVLLAAQVRTFGLLYMHVLRNKACL